MARIYLFAHEFIAGEVGVFMDRISNIEINGRRTPIPSVRLIMKELEDMQYRIARRCNILVSFPKMSIQGKDIVLGEPTIMLPSLQYVSYQELKEIEFGYDKRKEELRQWEIQ